MVLVVIVLLAVAAGWYFYAKSKTDTLSGLNTSAWDGEVSRNLSWMKNDPATVKLVQEKAVKNNVSYAVQLKNEAGGYAEENGFTRPTA